MSTRHCEEKSKGDVYIGVLISESNPPNIIEALVGLSAIGECCIDKIIYGVIDGESSDERLRETKEHRMAKAEAMVSKFSPLIEATYLGDGHPMSGEDAAFKLFGLNPELKFTLFYISQLQDPVKRVDSVDRLLTNIATRLHGFNPRLHKVVALFTPSSPKIEPRIGVRDIINDGLFKISYFDLK